MTFLEAYDGISSDDITVREEACARLLSTYRCFLHPEEREAIERIFNDAWEAVHEPKTLERAA